jgi:hypothetical protein
MESLEIKSNELYNGLKNLLSSYRADFKNITGSDLNDTETVIKTKELLKKYDGSVINNPLKEAIPHLKTVNNNIVMNDVIRWFNDNDIEYYHMDDIEMVCYYIENNDEI